MTNAEKRLKNLLVLYGVQPTRTRPSKALDYYVTAYFQTPLGDEVQLIADYSSDSERYVSCVIDKAYSHIGDVLRDMGLVSKGDN